jgi:hypothetical protein
LIDRFASCCILGVMAIAKSEVSVGVRVRIKVHHRGWVLLPGFRVKVGVGVLVRVSVAVLVRVVARGKR